MPKLSVCGSYVDLGAVYDRQRVWMHGKEGKGVEHPKRSEQVKDANYDKDGEEMKTKSKARKRKDMKQRKNNLFATIPFPKALPEYVPDSERPKPSEIRTDRKLRAEERAFLASQDLPIPDHLHRFDPEQAKARKLLRKA